MPDYRAWIEVDLGAIRHNLKRLSKWAAPARFMAVVKSDAYGHGMEAVAKVAVAEGAWGLAVVNIDEGLRLRSAGLTCPVLIVGPIFAHELAAALQAELSLPVYSHEGLRELAEAANSLGKSARVHVKFDTGLGRLALPYDQAPEFLTLVRDTPGLQIEGLYSHLADAEGLDQRYTLQQFTRFQEVQQVAAELGIQPEIAHLSASAASMLLQPARLDAVRLGIAMYGLWPADETRLLLLSRGKNLFQELNLHFQSGLTPQLDDLLQPALTYKTRIAQLKCVPADSSIGYGCTFVTQRPTTLAVLPVGYYEGYDRHLSNCGEVLVRGRRARVLGRVCMNVITVDVTDIAGVALDDEVVLLGRQGSQQVSAEEWARRIGTINYEVVTRLPAHLPRVYL
ncbi:alanine racemase [bacterium]|nr:alanine racemase [bacterium]